jgi:ecotin
MIFGITSIVLPLISAQAADNLKAFPPASKGMVRYVLQLPKESDESDFKLELIVGKTVEVDAENHYFFGGQIEEKTVEGWGFSYYQLTKLGEMAGTLMAVDPNAPKVKRFITVGGVPGLIRYNSQLPLVIYVPEGVEVKYRVWSAGSKTNEVEKG